MVRFAMLLLLLSACGSSDGTGGAGGDDAAGSGGLMRMSDLPEDLRASGRSASTADCVAFDSCGGDPEGEWSVDSICFFDADALLGQIALEPACAGLLADVTVYAAGSYRFDAGTLEQNVGYALDLQLRFDADCLDAATGGAASEEVCQAFEDDYLRDAAWIGVSCALDGDGCDCTLMSEDRAFDGSGEYALNGDQLDLGRGPQDFCLDGDRIQLRVMAAGLDGILTFTRR